MLGGTARLIGGMRLRRIRRSIRGDGAGLALALLLVFLTIFVLAILGLTWLKTLIP